MKIELDNGLVVKNAEIVASNDQKETKFYIAKFGDLWRFVVKFESSGETFITGGAFNSRKSILKAVGDNVTLADLTMADIVEGVPKIAIIEVNQDQRVALNTAYDMLKHSTSDRAEMAAFYIKQLLEQFK